MPTKTLALDEVSIRLGLSVDQVRSLVQSRRLPALQIDGAWRVRAADVDALATELLRESSTSVSAEALALANRYRACSDDAGFQLKGGDLFARWGSLHDAIQCYDRAAELFAADNAHAKVIAVSKQLTRLIDERLPELATAYRHVWMRLADHYDAVGLRVDAACARRRYDELG